MKTHLLISLRLTVYCMVFFIGVYVLLLLLVAQAAPGKGKGFVVIQDGMLNYMNVGQSFKQDKYFWSRPSAVNYNAAGSGGSNKGPSNPDYLEQVKVRIDEFLAHNPGIERSEIPSDLVTASGSGIDPHISVKAAEVQVKRIAKVRNISENNLLQLISKNTEEPFLGLLGTEKVNVLKLNLDLDELAKINNE